MENFVTKHPRGFLITVAVFLCVVIGLLAFIFVDFTVDEVRADYDEYLSVTETKNYARHLVSALSEGDIPLAYHSAQMAAYHASHRGKSDEVAFFSRISDDVKSGNAETQVIASEVLRFIESGDVTGGIDAAGIDYTSDDSAEKSPLSGYRESAAEKTANGIFDLHGALTAVDKNSDGRLIFTCENAYAVIDAASGMPLEAGISISAGQPILTSVECVELARVSLQNFFSAEIARNAALIESYNEEDGVYGMVFKGGDLEIVISVKQDTGKIVRMVVR